MKVLTYQLISGKNVHLVALQIVSVHPAASGRGADIMLITGVIINVMTPPEQVVADLRKPE